MKRTKNNPKNTSTPRAAKTGFFATIGHFLFGLTKVCGIVLLVGGILSAIVIPVSLALMNGGAPSAEDTYTVAGFNCEANTVTLENATGSQEVYLMGIILNPETPEADLEKYVGTSVTLDDDIFCGDYNADGILQAYIVVIQTEHVMQMDMMIDGVASLGELPKKATLYSEYWECATFGIYPEG